MNHIAKPLRFDMRALINKARRTINKRVTGTQIQLPGISFSVAPIDPEVKAARKIVIWIADRRVLKSKECCDSCIESSLESLLKIREYIVSQQVELADLTDGVLFFLLEFIAQGIRQFLTYEEKQITEFNRRFSKVGDSGKNRPHELRDCYFDALSILREHIQMALNQIAIIANISVPAMPDYLRVQSWELSHYVADESDSKIKIDTLTAKRKSK